MKKEKRFMIKHSEGNEFSTKIEIIVDKKTGVNYLLTKIGYGAGLTPLLDESGKPVISKNMEDIYEW